MPDFHEVPRFEDRWSYVYCEYGRLDADAGSLSFVNATGRTHIPIDQTSAVFLGPGTRVSIEGVKLAARNNCLICWSDSDAQRLYAHSIGGTHSSHRLLQQARLFCDPKQRLAVVRRMLTKRFKEDFAPNLTLQQMRGKEGQRVWKLYETTAQKYGLQWQGRKYDQNNWNAADPVNRALSAANALLYGLCHSAILSAGYSPAIGFIHSGKQLSFVYDVADCYKHETTIPVAFEIVSLFRDDIEKRVRLACRQVFFTKNLVKRILPDIGEVLDASDDLQERPNELEGRAVTLANRAASRSVSWEPE